MIPLNLKKRDEYWSDKDTYNYLLQEMFAYMEEADEAVDSIYEKENREDKDDDYYDYEDHEDRDYDYEDYSEDDIIDIEPHILKTDKKKWMECCQQISQEDIRELLREYFVDDNYSEGKIIIGDIRFFGGGDDNDKIMGFTFDINDPQFIDEDNPHGENRIGYLYEFPDSWFVFKVMDLVIFNLGFSI